MARNYTPRVLQDLPLNLMRSQAYPPAPWVTEQGVEEQFFAGPPPVYLPQRMGFTKYKHPPQGRSMTLAPSAVGVVDAIGGLRRRVQAIATTGLEDVPYGFIADVAEPLNQLPSVWAEEDFQEPLSRGALTRNDSQPGSRLDAIARAIALDPVSSARESYWLNRPDGFLFPDEYEIKRGG